jgi:hypothetical protein
MLVSPNQGPIQPFKCKVLLSVSNNPAHVWSVEVIQDILGSSFRVFDFAMRSQNGIDMDNFLIMAWASDPDLIPVEVGFFMPEPIEPFKEGVPPLFLLASEIIHSKCNLLHYRATINVLEQHEFSTPLKLLKRWWPWPRV